ncbi:MAG: transcription factor S [Candidatus Odinarchaeota archaeon]
MSFCEKCGAILMPEKDDNGKVFLVCPKCQNSNEVNRKKDDFLKLGPRKGVEKKKTIIIDKTELDEDAMASVEAQCPKCGHDKAQTWSLQTRSSDEASTIFFRCTKCGQTWRDYGG